MKKIYSDRDLGELLEVSGTTIGNWRRQGMPHKRLGPKTYSYDFERVVAWMVQQPRLREWIEELQARWVDGKASK